MALLLQEEEELNSFYVGLHFYGLTCQIYSEVTSQLNTTLMNIEISF